MFLKLLLIIFISLGISKPIDCSYHRETKSILLELEEFDTNSINKFCLEKRLCVIACRCNTNIYFEIPKNDFMKLTWYETKCQNPKDAQALEKVTKIVNDLKRKLEGLVSVSSNNQVQKLILYVNDLLEFSVKMNLFIQRIKKLCTEEQTSYTPQQQLKTLFQESGIDFSQDYFSKYLEEFVQEIISKVSPILAKPCPCIELTPTELEIKQGNDQCNIKCQNDFF